MKHYRVQTISVFQSVPELFDTKAKALAYFNTVRPMVESDEVTLTQGNFRPTVWGNTVVGYTAYGREFELARK